MADGPVTGFTEQTTVLTTDVLYLIDPTEAVATDRSKKATLANIAVFVNGVQPTPVNSDGNSYIQWEAAADVWSIRRISDGLIADISNNPTMTTTALAWTNRATLTYA